MVQKLWVPPNRKTTVCVDSYDNGIFRGRFYGADGEERPFCGLIQFLVLMEDMLEQTGTPQSYTASRRFSGFLQPCAAFPYPGTIRRGLQATFELQILFRQHTSWQGLILWKEQDREESFRSVLELVLLMDSALRGEKEVEAG